MRVVIENDDFGLNFGFTKAISDCYLNGITTSTAIRTNGTAFEHGVHNVLPKIRAIGKGLHLNLTDGKTDTEYLANHNKHYKRNFLGYYFALLKSNKKLLKEIENDFRKQFEIALKNKIEIDHVNGHDHIHMLPPIFVIAAKLTKEYKIPYLRVVNEDYYLTHTIKKDLRPFFNTNILKYSLLKSFAKENIKTLKRYKLQTSDCFYGLLYTDNMRYEAIKGAILAAKAKNYSLIEILAHPAYRVKEDFSFTSTFIKNYTNRKSRILEAQALKNKKLKNFMKKNNIILTSYRQ